MGLCEVLPARGSVKIRWMARLSKGGLARPGPGNGDSCYIQVAQGMLTARLTVESLCATLRQSGVAFSLSQRVNPQNPYLLPLNFRLPRIFFSYQLHGPGFPSWSEAGVQVLCLTHQACALLLCRGVTLPSPVESLAASCSSRVPSGNLGKPRPSRALSLPQAASLSSGVGVGREAGKQQPLTWLAWSVLRIHSAIVSAVPVSAPRHWTGSGKEP